VTGQAHLLAAIADHLDAAGIPFMVVGSFASSLYGQPRTTVDIDLVIDPSAVALRRFVESLSKDDYYVSAEAALEAFERRSTFNVIEHATGWKVDLMIRRERPFSRTEFDRRVHVDLFGRPTPVARAEDTIIAKLEWAKAGDSERQLRDVARILTVTGESVDQVYLTRWIEDLELHDAWDRARALADDVLPPDRGAD
jgi:hypothetical protein